jgi:TPR repeat protein
LQGISSRFNNIQFIWSRHIRIDFLTAFTLTKAAPIEESPDTPAPRSDEDNIDLMRKGIFWHLIVRNYDSKDSSDSLANIGMIYFHGCTDIPEDYKSAFFWLLEAAKRGNSE